jgi:ABC-2 type transport system ATP-binding protein
MSIVSVEHLTHGVGRHHVLEDVSFEVTPGRALAVVGPNGAGKSTLLKILATVIRPMAGTIRIDGVDPTRDVQTVRRRIGFVPDTFGIYPHLSVFQYVDFFARAAGVAGWERRDAVESMLRVVDLYETRNELAGSLSRGSTRRLALARALVHNPAVLIMDDPLLGLDGRGRLEIREVLRELSQMQITAVIASHLIADLADLCPDVLVLNEGRATFVGGMADVLETANRPQQRVRLRVLEQIDEAMATLETLGSVREIAREGHEVAFLLIGDDQALADVLRALLDRGVRVARFGHGTEAMDEISAGLSDFEGGRIA